MTPASGPRAITIYAWAPELFLFTAIDHIIPEATASISVYQSQRTLRLCFNTLLQQCDPEG